MVEPLIRFPEFKDALKERKFSDFTYAAGTRNKNNLPLEPYSITNIAGFVPQSEAHDEFGYMKDTDRSAYNIVKPYSFGYNPARINVGSLGYYSGDKDVIVSSLYEVFKTNDEVDDSFINYWFQTERFQNWIERLQEGSVRQYFYYDKLCEVRIALPSLEEQKKIADFLSSVDDVISACEKELEHVKELKRGMLQKMFPKNDEKVPEIRFPGFTGDWEQRKLGDAVEVFDGTHQTPKYQEYGVMFVSVENIQTLTSEKYISEEDYEKNYSVVPQQGDILMTRIGDIGTANIVKSAEPLAYYVSLALLKNKGINAEFLKANISAPSFQNELWIRTLHTAYPKKINKEEIGKCTISIAPSSEERERIGTFFEDLDKTITLHQRELDKWKELKKGLLQQLFV